MEKTPITLHFDEMCWPRLGESFAEVAWKLRYNQAAMTKSEMFIAASVMDAFDALIGKTQKQRNYIAEVIKTDAQQTAESERK